MSDLLYRKYSVPYKRPHGRYPKYYSAAYNETIQDMRKDIVLVLLRLLNDKNFTAESEAALYSKLLFEMVKHINCCISISPYTAPDEIITVDGEIVSFINTVNDTTVNIEADITDPENAHKRIYRIYIDEILKILQSCDITELCQSDAEVQKNIINMIIKYYRSYYNEKTDIVRYPNEKEMLDFYRSEHGEISQSQYSRALGAVFKILCNCTTSLKGYSHTRAEFIKAPDTPQIRCTEISEAELEEMLKKYVQLGYETDKSIDDILRTAAGTNTSEIWWSLSPNKSGYSIIRLRENADGSGYKRYGNNNNRGVVMDGKIISIKAGKCRLFITDRKIYSYAADKELFYIKRIENDYVGYRLTA